MEPISLEFSPAEIGLIVALFFIGVSVISVKLTQGVSNFKKNFSEVKRFHNPLAD